MSRLVARPAPGLLLGCFLTLAAAALEEPDAGALEHRARSHLFNDEPLAALQVYSQAVSDLEKQLGTGSIKLPPLLGGKAGIHLLLNEPDEALDLLQRAQQLIHLEEGVLSSAQLRLLDLATLAWLLQDDPLEANRQQRLYWHIASRAHAVGSPPWTAGAHRIAEWYLHTGQHRLARKSDEELQEILRELYGEESPKLLPVLLRMARNKQLGGSCCAHRQLAEAVRIAEVHAEEAPLALAEARVAQGDAFVMARMRKKADQAYRAAWQALDGAEDSRGAELFAGPKPVSMRRRLTDDLAPDVILGEDFRKGRLAGFSRSGPLPFAPERLEVDELPPQEFILDPQETDRKIMLVERREAGEKRQIKLVGKPFRFNLEQLRSLLPFRLHSEEALAELFIELSFTVDESGRVRNLQVVDENAPARLTALMRRALRKAAFRPRIQDGEPALTRGHRLRQTFRTELDLTAEFLPESRGLSLGSREE